MIVQAGSERSAMATVQDQEEEHHRRLDHGSRGDDESSRVTMALGGLSGAAEVQDERDLLATADLDMPLVKGCRRDQSRQTERRQVPGPNAQKTT